jgi:hypothetical protein
LDHGQQKIPAREYTMDEDDSAYPDVTDEEIDRAINAGWTPGQTLDEAMTLAGRAPGTWYPIRPDGGLLPESLRPQLRYAAVSENSDGEGNDYLGNEDGSVAADEISDIGMPPVQLAATGAPAAALVRAVKERSGRTAIYGETSGLYAQKKNPNGSTYDPNNWDPDSQAQLQEGRRWIAEVQRRNPSMKYNNPTGNNPLEARQWEFANDAANRARSQQVSPSEDTKIFLRQDGVGPQAPPWHGYVLDKSFGPFVNVGGGDVPKGDKTYIEIHRKGP